MMMKKSYTKLMQLPTFEERFEYLKVSGLVGADTFGHDRYINQVLYTSREWRSFRNKIIARDNGCDLGMSDREIQGPVTVHHINPITLEDIENRSPSIFDPDNVICVSDATHKAIHYGDINNLVRDPIERRPNDTCPWRKY